MSEYRHEWWHQGSEPPALRGGGWVEAGFHVDAHAHGHGQLLYAASGAMSTTTDTGTWVSPTNRVTWTPPGFYHSHHFFGRCNVRLVEIPKEFCGNLADHPVVYRVSALLREILLAFTDRDDPGHAALARLLAVASDELTVSSNHQLYLPEPEDDRLRTVTDLLHADPAQTTTLTELGRKSGASGRTLSRLFSAELGMSFQQWRALLRIHRALALLAADTSVTDTAIACGWSNPSSFIEAFTAIVGQTPGSYVVELHRAV